MRPDNIWTVGSAAYIVHFCRLPFGFLPHLSLCSFLPSAIRFPSVICLYVHFCRLPSGFLPSSVSMFISAGCYPASPFLPLLRRGLG
ncbi:MAG: hypothetical protein IJ204_05875 [Paludibacteraceae bacterium]|nr:hypothetical protein [Paludibacteraceae bacterium]